MLPKELNLKSQVAQVEKKNRGKSASLKSFGAIAFPVALVSMLVGGQVFAQGQSMEKAGTEAQVQRPGDAMSNDRELMQQDTQLQTDEMKAYQFSKVDLNNDEKVNWAELKLNYSASLDRVDWDEDKIFTSFDRDNNTYLDQDEFSEFYAALKDEREMSDVPDVSVQTSADTPVNNPMANKLPHRVSDDRDMSNAATEINEDQARAISVITTAEPVPENSGMTVAEVEARNMAGDDGAATRGETLNEPGIVNANSNANISKPVTLTDTSGQLAVERSELIDKEVYNLNGQHIGEVEDLVFNGSRGLQGAVIEVGGFLGVGERNVFVHVSQLRFDRQQQQVVWQSMMTEDELDDLPEYDKDQLSLAN